MKNKTSIMKVDKDFKNILKAEASLNGKTVIEFTREVADNNCFFTEYLKENKDKGVRRKNGFGFRF